MLTHYPPNEQGWSPGITMALFLSLAFAAGGTMLGEVWFWFAEGFRIDNSHELPSGTIFLGSTPSGVVRGRSDHFLAGCI